MRREFDIIEAATEIIKVHVPVLFLDTCSVLDIIRAPSRKELQNNIITSALRLIAAARSGPRKLWIITSSVVCSELYDHLHDSELELERFIISIDERIAMINDASSMIGPYVPIPLYRSKHINLPENLIRVALGLVEQSITIGISDTYKLSATNRVIQCKPPAKKGGQLKDCLIIEHYLALCKKLRELNFNDICVFTSSNTKDYCRDGSLATSLKEEFDSVSLEYTSDLAWAESLIL